jgi:hypothetical protein
MTMTTIRASIAPRGAHSLVRRTERRHEAFEVIALVAVAAMTAVAGAAGPAIVAGVLAAAATGSWSAAAAVAGLGLPFIAVTAPAMAIWLLGAIGTRRAVWRSRDRGLDRAQ